MQYKKSTFYINIFLIVLLSIFLLDAFSLTGHNFIKKVLAGTIFDNGTGVPNFMARFVGAAPSTTVGNSIIYDDGISVGIDKSNPSPSYKLDVNGHIRAYFGGATGYVGLDAGTAAMPGFVEWFRADGTTRIGYLGWGSGGATNLGLNLENGANFNINRNGLTGGNVGIANSNPSYKLDVGPIGGTQTTTSGAGGLIRNNSAADTAPYTQPRIVVYGGTGVDTTNWGYLGYGSDAIMRIVYGKTGSGSLSFGTSNAIDGTGVYTNRATLDGSGNFSVTGNVNVGGNLAVTGNTTLGGTLTVTGVTNLSSLNVNGSPVTGGGGGNISGSGTLGTVPMFTPNGTTLGNSPLTYDGSDVTKVGNGGVPQNFQVPNGYIAGSEVRVEGASGKYSMKVTSGSTLTSMNYLNMNPPTNSIYTMRLNPDGTFNNISLTGNVGLGTNSPVGKLHIFSGGAGGVGWSTGFNIGDATNYSGLIQDAGVSRWRNFGTGGYDWYSSGGAQLLSLSNAGLFKLVSGNAIFGALTSGPWGAQPNWGGTVHIIGNTLGTPFSGLHNGNSQLQISSDQGPVAIAFHRPGIYGAEFGLDTDNQFSTQGWSAGGGYTGLKVGRVQSVTGGGYGLGAICGSSQCIHFNNNGWMYTGDTANNVPGGVGIYTDKLISATTISSGGNMWANGALLGTSGMLQTTLGLKFGDNTVQTTASPNLSYHGGDFWTVYQAQSDGFAVGNLGSNVASCFIMGHSDSTNPPTSSVIVMQGGGGAANSTHYLTATMPVRKGDYFSFDYGFCGNGGGGNVIWVPFSGSTGIGGAVGGQGPGTCNDGGQNQNETSTDLGGVCGSGGGGLGGDGGGGDGGGGGSCPDGNDPNDVGYCGGGQCLGGGLPEYDPNTGIPDCGMDCWGGLCTPRSGFGN